MVKQGEVWRSDRRPSYAQVERGKRRGRHICNPARVTLGLPQAVSSHVQSALVSLVDEFVCGLDLQGYAQLVKGSGATHCLVTDGSGFDSTQFEENQRICQEPLWDIVSPLLPQWTQAWGAADPDQLANDLDRHFHTYTNIVFANFPGIEASWNQKMRRAFQKSGLTGEERNWLPLELKGTTFSGHSFRTTVGNTLNSILYVWDHARSAGYKEPWNDERFTLRVSGDDVLLMGPEDDLKRIAEVMKARTSNGVNDARAVGHGQILKHIDVLPIEHAEFCSKKFVQGDHDIVAVPDIQKALSTKLYYKGQNVEIHHHPWIHAEAKRRHYSPLSRHLAIWLELCRDTLEKPKHSHDQIEQALSRHVRTQSSRFHGEVQPAEQWTNV